MTLHLYSMFLPAFHIPIFNWLTSWPHNQDIPESSYFSLYPRNSHIIKQGGIESWKNQKALWRSWTKSEKNKLGTLSDQTAQGEAQSPGRQERVKSFPLQYKRKECAERLGFLLLQWELQKRREEAEEKKGGVSPLKTCRDWERKRERVRDRESEGERERDSVRTSLSVCLCEGRTSLLHSDLHWGRGISWLQTQGGDPTRSPWLKLSEHCPSLSHLSLPGNVSAKAAETPTVNLGLRRSQRVWERWVPGEGGGALSPSLCGSGQGKGRAPGPWAKPGGGLGHWGLGEVEMQGVKRWPVLGRSPAWLFSGLILFVLSVLFFSRWNGVFKLALSPHPRVFSPGPPLLTGLCAVAK